MNDCLFCKIIKKDLPAQFEYEDEEMVAFKDINPKAPIHILIIPKKHIDSVNEIKENDAALAGRLILLAKKIAKDKGLDKLGYKLIFNVGKGGGQIIDHIHLHLLGGWTKE